MERYDVGPVSVELVLDADGERAVRADWDALADRGLSSLAAYQDPSNRPHVSLFSGTTQDRAEALAGSALAIPLAVRLGAPVLFGTGPRRVLARTVVPTSPLLDLQSAIAYQLRPDQPEDLDARSQPGTWMPHVTIARRLQLSSLELALELLGPDVDGEGVGIRLWNSETRTVTTISGSA